MPLMALYLGNSVAISGDTAVIGAWEDHIGANKTQGSVYARSRAGSLG